MSSPTEMLPDLISSFGERGLQYFYVPQTTEARQGCFAWQLFGRAQVKAEQNAQSCADSSGSLAKSLSGLELSSGAALEQEHTHPCRTPQTWAFACSVLAPQAVNRPPSE